MRDCRLARCGQHDRNPGRRGHAERGSALDSRLASHNGSEGKGRSPPLSSSTCIATREVSAAQRRPQTFVEMNSRGTCQRNPSYNVR